MANIRFKFNLKLGSTNYLIKPEKLKFIRQKKTIVIKINMTYLFFSFLLAVLSITRIVALINKLLK